MTNPNPGQIVGHSKRMRHFGIDALLLIKSSNMFYLMGKVAER